MSRIVVKNLPLKISEEKLREIFSEKGTITDIQLKFTPEGKFRQFAFIGYYNEEEAEEAIKYYNNMCIKTNRIVVERCALLNEANKLKPWSKYANKETQQKTNAKDSNAEEKKKSKDDKKKSKTIELLEKYKNDPLFEEFMEVHSHQDALLKLLEKTKEKNPVEEEDEEKEPNNANDDSCNESNDKLACQNISDMEYMKKLISKEDSEELLIPTKPRQKMEKKKKEKIELFTVKLRGLPYTCKKKDIKQFFEKITIYSLRIPRTIKGIAYVGFKTEKHFKKALLKDKSFIKGKQIFVCEYSSKKSSEGDHINENKNMKWKSQEDALKNEEDVAESGRIFLRNLAYTTTEKDVEELFSKYGPLVEVNLPLDSATRKIKGFGFVTYLMPEHAVKAYSELDGTIFQGRMLHLLPGKAKDSVDKQSEDTTNYKKKKSAQQKAQAGSLHNWNALFLGHDAVAEVMADTYETSKEAVLNPHGNGSVAVRLALGETQIIATTKKYLEQEGVVLDVFSAPTTKRSKTVILVKNLPARTEKSEITQLFNKFGVLGRVILPPNGITAVVEFVEPSEARKAFTKLAYSKFKNLPLYLEWAPENVLVPKSEISSSSEKQDIEEQSKSENTAEVKQEESNSVVKESKKENKTKQTGTKILVRNVPFQANRSEIYELFKTFGEIKACRLPKKMSVGATSHRGFAFVDFVTESDAKKAFDALCQSTHLYGRRLVLEWAVQDEGVEQIRKRTSEHFKPTTQTVSKKSIFKIDGN